MTATITLENDGIAEYVGRQKFVTGYFSFTGDSSQGTASTGLRRITSVSIQQSGTAIADAKDFIIKGDSGEATFPMDTGDVIIIASGTAANGVKGSFVARGD